MIAFCEHRPAFRYPPRAFDRLMDGMVRLDCEVAEPEGTLLSCRVVEETPPRMEFADAGLRIACRLSYTPDDVASAAPLGEGEAPRNRLLYRDSEGKVRVHIAIPFTLGR